MKETDKIYPADKGEEELLHNVRHILQEARAKVIHHVNSTLVRAYWQVGKYIVEYEQQGTGRAGYGKAVSTPFPGGSWRSSETGSRPPTCGT